jgi:hypothetical protein
MWKGGSRGARSGGGGDLIARDEKRDAQAWTWKRGLQRGGEAWRIGGTRGGGNVAGGVHRGRREAG